MYLNVTWYRWKEEKRCSKNKKQNGGTSVSKLIKGQNMNGYARFLGGGGFGASMVRNRCHLQKSPSDDANISFVWAHFPVATVDVFFQRRSNAAGARASHREIKISECSLRKRVNPPQCRSVQEAVRVQSRWLRYWTARMFFCFSFSALLMLPNNIGVANDQVFWGKACFVVTLTGQNVASFN